MKFKIHLPSLRLTSLLGSFYCFGLLAFAWYLQTVIGVDPCPLCIIQRGFFLLVGILFFFGALYTSPHRKQQCWFYSAVLVFALLGGLVAGWQVHLQHLPPAAQMSGCGADLSFVMQNMPFMASLRFLLEGTGSCHEVKWTLLGLSIPFWSLVSFLGLAGISLWQMLRKSMMKS